MLPVRLYTDNILHTPCQPVGEITQEIVDLATEMLITMKAHMGVGLSANQVGENKRLCVISVNDKASQMILVNPVLTHGSIKDKVKMQESCLSCPGLVIEKKRYKEVVVEAILLNGDKVKYHFTDFDARIIQHEVDHLNGIILSDPVDLVIR